jgi:acyl-coenzyme A thioesterase PaaI-like protein
MREIKKDPIAMREKWRKLPDYGCLWSSPDNPRGFQLTPTIEPGRLFVEMKVEREHSGFPGIAHGGVAYTVLDGLMGWFVLSHYGRAGVTMRSEVRYFAPLQVGRTYLFQATEPEPGVSAERTVRLIGKVLTSAESGIPLVEVDATFYLPDRAMAKKLLKVDLGPVGEELFPEEPAR